MQRKKAPVRDAADQYMTIVSMTHASVYLSSSLRTAASSTSVCGSRIMPALAYRMAITSGRQGTQLKVVPSFMMAPALITQRQPFLIRNQGSFLRPAVITSPALIKPKQIGYAHEDPQQPKQEGHGHQDQMRDGLRPVSALKQPEDADAEQDHALDEQGMARRRAFLDAPLALQQPPAVHHHAGQAVHESIVRGDAEMNFLLFCSCPHLPHLYYTT